MSNCDTHGAYLPSMAVQVPGDGCPQCWVENCITQITELRTKVERLQSRIRQWGRCNAFEDLTARTEAAEAKNERLREEVVDLTAEVGGLEGYIQSVEAECAALRAVVEELDRHETQLITEIEKQKRRIEDLLDGYDNGRAARVALAGCDRRNKMPNRDGTGPQGLGPGTGRRAGDCVDEDAPEKTDDAPNRGRGRGRRRGGQGGGRGRSRGRGGKESGNTEEDR